MGLAWAGDPRHPNDRNRSIRLAELWPLFALDVAFVSMQKDVQAAQPNLSHFSSQLRDFADTAALISCLDLVITVDALVAYLAGAMGKPVWILLCSNPDGAGCVTAGTVHGIRRQGYFGKMTLGIGVG